jgi:hypothetical protein
MATGDFTKEEGEFVKEGLNEVLEDLSDEKTMDYLGHFNDAFMFIDAAIQEAPSEEEDSSSNSGGEEE